MQTEFARSDTENLLIQWGIWSRHPDVRGYAHQTSFRAMYTMGGRPPPACWLTDDEALRLDRTVASLGADSLYHRVLLLHFVFGKNGGAVAKILDMPRSSAYNAIAAAVGEIHARLYGATDPIQVA